MKIIKISLIALLFCVSKTNYAQLEKGTKSIGGTLSGHFFITPNKYTDNKKDIAIHLNPSFGLMFKNNIMFMAGVTFGYSKAELPFTRVVFLT
jgi:hypothetical protein